MPYHHGQLRGALVEAGVALARASGPDAVVLRAVSRDAGVSHNAAYRHFEDRDALLREVCVRCMEEFARLIEKRYAELGPAPEAWAGLDSCGRAYLEFALTEPGWFRTAFAVPRGVGMFQPGEGCGVTGLNPYQLLGARLDDLVAAGELAPERRVGAEFGAWSSVHGLALLLLDGPLRDLSDPERQFALEMVLRTVTEGL